MYLFSPFYMLLYLHGGDLSEIFLFNKLFCEWDQNFRPQNYIIILQKDTIKFFGYAKL